MNQEKSSLHRDAILEELVVSRMAGRPQFLKFFWRKRIRCFKNLKNCFVLDTTSRTQDALHMEWAGKL
jgi:hypothetical protein